MTVQHNTLINEPQPEPMPQAAPEPKPEHRLRKRVSGGVSSVLGGSFLVRQQVIRLLPFLLFLTILGLIYIFSTNYANRTIISISKTKKQNEELRFDYITTRSKLMQASRQSEVAEKLETYGIKESKIPPRKIVITTINK